ncbi:ABC transporter permease [Corynebacterium camporealensis]
MLVNTFKAEWTKLHTTRSFWWTTALFFFFVLGWALLMGTTVQEPSPEMTAMGIPALTADMVLAVLVLMGLPVLMIQAIMVVTTEYRYGVQTTTYMANPRRWMVALVKLVMYAFIAALFVLVGIVVAYALADAVAKPGVSDTFNPFEDDFAQRTLWVYPVAAALLVLFSQGVGLLLRQTAGTVALCLILYLGIESFIAMIPRVGEDIVNFMPFSAFNNWLSDIAPPDNMFWDSSTGYLVIFIIWSVVLWVAGVLTLQKRDA